MDIRGELATTVSMSEEVADDGEDDTKGLTRNVPSRADDLGEVSLGGAVMQEWNTDA